MKKHLSTKLLALFLTVVLCLGLIVPAGAVETENDSGSNVIVEKVDNSVISADLRDLETVDPVQDAPLYAASDIVRVSIVLSGKSTLEVAIDSGISTQSLAVNATAKEHRAELLKNQQLMANKISMGALGGEPLDVVWNLTLAANIISANVKYGQIEAIERISGVETVFVETEYEPAVVTKGDADPNMATSSEQIGSNAAYLAGYTGAGSRIAVIDTGTDIDHQSFDNDAFLYALKQNAAEAGMSYSDYVDSLDLLDKAEISSLLSQLNIAATGVTAADLYGNEKQAFNFNYVDVNLNVTHRYDVQGEHGSHVAGIATANRYIETSAGVFEDALDTALMQGVAPDAQLITMKVFGENGGAYDSDYMAAIEDAIILGADSINLSLGSSRPGMTTSSTYQAILDSLSGTDTVVVISAGNSYSWADFTYYGISGIPYLFAEDVSMHTGGSPGTYTNSLGVASVENSGATSMYMEVDGNRVAYTESRYDSDGYAYGNAAFATLSGEQNYVFLNGVGTASEFSSISRVVRGKIVLCYRGEISFYEKANNAAAYGAKGIIVVNNQSGVLYMNLSGYNYSAPVVAITQAAGEYFKTNPVTDSYGSVKYWTGKMTVSAAIGAVQSESEYYTMSEFSSWGVPGDLSIKPEITAPGGSIYSVYGETPYGGGSDQYELMSGTSMAAPQVTGMMALLMQYIRENDLSVDGLTDRALAQSLLMSTAEPLLEETSGSYYSVLKQGAGLANIGAAILANSYILMDDNATASAADGKVKVELGDDPDKTGEYEFSFTINNMTDELQSYTLSAELFTQDLFSYSGHLFMDSWTSPLDANVTWLVDGRSVVEDTGLTNMDFDGDGNVDTDDGQALLDYATGARTQLSNTQYADLDGDGDMDSYDAYLFFRRFATGAVQVPANGSVRVTVQIELTDEVLAYYPNGAYVEGYVFAKGLSTAEGVQGDVHSIPVLGFYGSWTDPSMYDEAGYLYYYTGGDTNFASMKYADSSGEYYFGGNPYISDSTYMPERNALNNQRGDQIYKYYYTSIRNAGNAMILAENVKTGETYLKMELNQTVYGAYYSVNAGAWYNAQNTQNLGWTGTDGNGKPLPENTTVNLSLVLAPEYYANADGTYNWDALGDGAYLSTMVTIDNTAPVLDESSIVIDESADTLTLSVTDNQYVAFVGLYEEYGQYVYTYEGSKADAKAGDTVEYVLDISQVNGSSFLLRIADYADNQTTYKITRQIGTVTNYVTGITLSHTGLALSKGDTATLTATVRPFNATERGYTWSTSDRSVATVDANGVVTAKKAGTAEITATSKGKDKYGYAVTATCTVYVYDIKANLNAVVWDEYGEIWFSKFNTGTLPEYTKLTSTSCSARIASLTYGGSTLYGASFENGISNVYKINTRTYEPTLIGGSDVFYADISYAPHLDGGSLMAVYGGYVLMVDPDTGNYLGAWDWGSDYLVGITYIGSTYDSYYGAYVDEFYLLDASGRLYKEEFMEWSGRYYYFNGEEEGLIGSSGVVADVPYYQSIYLSDDYLFFSNYVAEDNCVTIYAWDRLDSGYVYELGKFNDGVWPVGGLIELGSSRSSSYAAGEESEERTARIREENACVMGIAIEPEISIAAEPSGTLNSVADYETPARPASAVEESSDEMTVTLTVTAKTAGGVEVASTNGVETVTYDPSVLTLESIVVHADYQSIVRDDANGTVTIGYVSLAEHGIPAGEAVATLTFTVKKEAALTLSVKHKETGNLKPGYTETHTYDEIGFDWTDDIGGWTAVIISARGDMLATSFTVVLDGSELTLSRGPEGVAVVAAAYDANGKMTDCWYLGDLSETATHTITGETIKLFFLDSETQVPLIDSLTVK